MDKIYFLVFFIFLSLMFGVIFLFGRNVAGKIIKSNVNEPEEVIANLYKAINVAEEKGEYRCCIKPACTMCYLGHWKFEEGTCYCDDAIIEGRDEDVCPECIKGIEKGLCSSDKQEDCTLNEEIYG